MKNILFLLLSLFAFVLAHSQEQVKWNFTATKKDGKLYEIKITGTVGNGWHIYSQTTPGGGPLPTKIEFKKNPLVVLDGTIKELGKMVTKREEDIETRFYSDKIEFVQLVQLRSAAKTSLGGTVEFMVCNDEQCIPPTVKSFNLLLN